MAYTNIDDPTLYFNTVTYTGSGSGQSVTGVNFQPDLVWLKRRSATGNHYLVDSVRGVQKSIFSNADAAESSDNYVISFNSDGFSLGADNYTSPSTIVGWNWLAGGTASSNTDGSITSTVSANTTSGFSIATYTGNGTSGANFGHGLGVKPACVIVKRRDTTSNWQFVSKALSATPFASGNYLKLNSTDAMGTNTAVWNAEPTSSLIYLTSSADTNSSGGTYVCLAFVEKKSFSKFGSYTGNGSADGTFVYTGFKPAMVIVKNTNSVTDWIIKDNKRSTYNVVGEVLYPNGSYAEDASGALLDFTSNGFKLRISGASAPNVNESGSTFIYMAFASEPLVGTNNIPATAR